MVFLSEVLQHLAVCGECRLVGGDDVFPGFQGVCHVSRCRLDSADQFHDDVDLAVFDDLVRIGHVEFFRDVDAAVHVRSAVQDLYDLDGSADRSFDLFAVEFQSLIGTFGDVADAENAEFDAFHNESPLTDNSA